MQHLQYFIHLLLNYKYKFIINLIFYILILLIINNTQLTYCMTEGDTPSIAEAKTKIELTNLEQLIHRNIDSYIGDKALIAKQQEVIDTLQKELAFRREYSGLVLGDDGVADAIANRGLQPYVNEICRKHGRPLSYPWIDEYGNYKEDY